MRGYDLRGHDLNKGFRCEVSHLVDGEACVQIARENVDGLVLCERHALEAKLEGQIRCWGGMLFHIDLWSREARRRERPDVARLLQEQRTQAVSAIERAHEDLDLLMSREPNV